MNSKVKAGIGITIVVILLIIILVATSIKRLDTDEVGIKYDTIWRKLGKEAQNEGLYTGSPGFEFIVFPNIFSTIEFLGLTCLNKDGVKIILDVSYQYKVRAGTLRETIDQFRDHEGYEVVLKAAGKAAIHETCCQYNTTQFQSERGLFQETLRRILVERYDILKADITDLQVNDIKRPKEYEDAVKGKEAAREHIKVAENERPRSVTQANTKKREAETQANITIAKAESNARIIQNRALAEATAILNAYKLETETYKNLVSANGLDLTMEGFLSYIGVRVISEAKNPVYVGLKSPAKSSYVQP